MTENSIKDPIFYQNLNSVRNANSEYRHIMRAIFALEIDIKFEGSLTA